ncbi:MAG TPA: hypothetical protein VIK33_16255 [Anaerolineae bacterium]
MTTSIVTQVVNTGFEQAAVNTAMLEHLANIIKDTWPELANRVDRAVGIVQAGDILPGRGEVRAPDAWVGGQGPTPVTAMEIAQAVPHHRTSQETYSITAHYYAGEYPEYQCTCRDASGTDCKAPYVPGIGVCCKHVLAVVLLIQIAPDLQAIQMTDGERVIAEKCIKAGILTQRPDHPLARFLVAQRLATKAAHMFGSPCPWHQKIAWFEKFQAARMLAEWRTSEHWQKWVGGVA